MNNNSDTNYNTNFDTQNKIPFCQNNYMDTDSDSDDYIDLSTSIEENAENIYQFVVQNEILELKHIGKCNIAPDIILMENFGPDSNLNLYNCVYTQNELVDAIETNFQNLMYPLVKLIITKNDNFDIVCIGVKIFDSIKNINALLNLNNKQNEQNEQNELNEPNKPIIIDGWELCFVENKHNEPDIKTAILEKNINASNIIEKIIELGIK